MRAEKQLLLDEIKGKINKSNSFILTKYTSLKANSSCSFRNELAKVGAELEVVRKRVFVKAAGSLGILLDVKDLEGHIGVIFSESDPIEATKVAMQYGQSNEKAIQVIGARLDGRLYHAADVEKLSKLPGKDEMRAELLGLFEAPMAQTLAVMEALLSSVIYCLDNKSQQSS
ncbi:MAG: 50S ribosomal protein L10 [Chlamydiales bacterium]|nr:50S ribosomal protein L10 [Chlamydiales bacterium]